MSNGIEQAITAILKGDNEALLIPCTSDKHRNVMRTTAFRMRNKMEKDSVFKKSIRDVGISNEDLDGIPCLKIYIRKDIEMLVQDEDGKWVKWTSNPETDPESLRIFDLMVKDKISVEEITAVMQDYNWTESFITEKLIDCIYEDKPLFPQDIEKREKLVKGEV